MEGANRLRGSGLDSSFGVPTLSFYLCGGIIFIQQRKKSKIEIGIL